MRTTTSTVSLQPGARYWRAPFEALNVNRPADPVEIERSVSVPAPPERVFVLVDDLSCYPRWMQLVHSADGSTPEQDGRPAWNVELRARVGPLARSKRLRMVRTIHDPPRSVAFERCEIDGRTHAPWILRADLDPVADSEGEIVLTMKLCYGGGLWTGAVLQRVLDDEVRKGSDALLHIVSSEPTR